MICPSWSYGSQEKTVHRSYAQKPHSAETLIKYAKMTNSKVYARCDINVANQDNVT